MASNLDPFTRPPSIRIQDPSGKKNAQYHVSETWSRLQAPEDAHLAQVWAGLERRDEQRFSTFSKSSSLCRASSQRRTRVSDFELDLNSKFRVSWCTDLDIYEWTTGDNINVIEETPEDENIVDWEGPDDPENPLNWPRGKKWANIVTISIITLIT